MRSRALGVGIALAALAAAVVLFVVLRDDEEPEPSPTPVVEEPAPGAAEEPEPAEPRIPEIVVRDGEPVGGVAELEFRRGERVEFAIRTDADDEIHVHGYDINRDVEAGERTRVDFPAELDGVFEVELHDAGHVEIARITVSP
jgi:hypothetical protein